VAISSSKTGWNVAAFDVKTGDSEYPVNERVKVFALRVEGDDLLVQIDAGGDAARLKS